MPSASTLYIAAQTNRHNHAASVSPNASLVAVAAGKFIALWNPADPTRRGVYTTLPGHAGEVTSVAFVTDNLFVSADDRGELIVWELREVWLAVARAKPHQRAVSALSVFTQADRALVVSGSSEATVSVMSLNVSTAELVPLQTIELRGRYALDIQIASLPDSSALVMAIGTTARTISLYTQSEGHTEWGFALSLPGHDDWVRCLSFTQQHENSPLAIATLVLASGSQDNTIRLWQIRQAPVSGNKDATDELLDAFEAALGDLSGDTAEGGGRTISLKQHAIGVRLKDGSQRVYHITFDALLVGHEAALTSIAWRPSTTNAQRPTLLSTSTDSSVILWQSDPDTALWVPAQRFGDIGGQKLGGFVGGLWVRTPNSSPQTYDPAAWGWAGGWRRWKQKTDNRWEEVQAITGHQSVVRGVCWSPDGSYLLSTSYDQSSRVHGPVDATGWWHELGRPQVHGYDLIAATFIGSDSLRFVSVADERVARVFDAPGIFTELLEHLNPSSRSAVHAQAKRPLAASVPPLGLSNKADAIVEDQNLDKMGMLRVPLEGDLAQRTLWPESDKIFGHGYELISIASSYDGTLVATSCKATTPEHAVVRLFNARPGAGWVPGATLPGHSLTVTRISWSPDDQYIVTVSRDRSWRLFGPRGEDDTYPPLANAKAHSRIIWDCAWSLDGSYFVTVARDKTARVWTAGDGQTWQESRSVALPDAGTAVAITRNADSSKTFVAVGMENGHVVIYSTQDATSPWEQVLLLDSTIASIDQVYQIAWRPKASQANPGAQLALCSEDGTLRVLDVPLV